VKPRKLVGTAQSPDGTRLELIEHDGAYTIVADGLVLMSTRNRRSEEELARIACAELSLGARVLIGGLGMGFTLRATLDILSPDSRVTQVELIPEIVEWNRGPLGDRSGHPADDPRAELVVGDVAAIIRTSTNLYDAIILDVDNGPNAMVDSANSWLYSSRGLHAARQALKAGGCLAIWSVDNPERFVGRMEASGLRTTVHRVSTREKGGGSRHVIFLGRCDSPRASG
jgi:spermidine synthase